MATRSRLSVLNLLLFFTLTTPPTQASCPSACQCTRSRTGTSIVNCANRGLTKVPAEVDSEVTDLDLSGNQLTVISAASVAHLKNLANLILDDNRITDIEAFSFKHFNNIKKLSIKRNSLTSVRENAFSGASGHPQCSKTNITCLLDLTGNNIDIIESNAFSWISNLSVSIGSTGTTTTIQNYAFYGAQHVPSITIMNIPNLELQKHWASEMDNVEQLHIADSVIPQVTKYAFEGLRNVKVVMFENCSLTSVQEYGFSGIKFAADNVVSRDFSSRYLRFSAGISHSQDAVIPPKYTIGADENCGGVLMFKKCRLPSVPTDAFRDVNLKYLIIKGTQIGHIKQNAFRGLDCLHKFQLSDNSFTNGLEEKSFGSIKQVQEVIFENNDIFSVKRYAFYDTQGIGRLAFHLKANTNLSLQSNSLKGLLDIYTFQINGIESNTNRLVLHKHSFSGAADINNITLSNLYIPNLFIHSFRGIGSVNSLNMVETKLDSISRTSFDNFPVRSPIKTLSVVGETGLDCECSLLRFASDFDNMFDNYTVMCKDGEFYTDVSVELYHDKQCDQDISNSVSQASHFVYSFNIVIFSLFLMFFALR